MSQYNMGMRIEECINFQLTEAQAKVNNIFRQNLGEKDITPAQYMLLYHLWKEDAQTPSQLALVCGYDAPTITRLLTQMEKKDLAYREHSSSDRRVVEVLLTTKGKSLQKDIERIIEKSNNEVLSSFSGKEKEVLSVLLEKIKEEN